MNSILNFFKNAKNLLIVGLIIAIAIMGIRLANLSNKYEDAKANEKAFIAKLNKAQSEINVFKFTIDQMKMIEDSTFQRMTYVIDSLKIKNKNLISSQYHKTVITKTDTLVLKDTIYKDPNFCLDTLLGDKWVETKLHMHYPGTISVTPKVTSEKVCIVSLKKETVNPPKKCWIARLFQKKHKVAKVNIVESNPYMTEQENTFVQIVK